MPLDNWRYIASARYLKHHDCLNYLLEKGSPEPTDEEYDLFVEEDNNYASQQRLRGWRDFRDSDSDEERERGLRERLERKRSQKKGDTKNT